jgi:hypothetical protein
VAEGNRVAEVAEWQKWQSGRSGRVAEVAEWRIAVEPGEVAKVGNAWALGANRGTPLSVSASGSRRNEARTLSFIPVAGPELHRPTTRLHLLAVSICSSFPSVPLVDLIRPIAEPRALESLQGLFTETTARGKHDYLVDAHGIATKSLTPRFEANYVLHGIPSPSTAAIDTASRFLISGSLLAPPGPAPDTVNANLATINRFRNYT